MDPPDSNTMVVPTYQATQYYTIQDHNLNYQIAFIGAKVKSSGVESRHIPNKGTLFHM